VLQVDSVGLADEKLKQHQFDHGESGRSIQIHTGLRYAPTTLPDSKAKRTTTEP